MEKNVLNNKLEKDSKNSLTKLNIGLTSLSGMMDSALDEVYKSIDKVLTKKQAAQYKAYLNKHNKLVAEGKHKTAAELKNPLTK